MTQNLLWFGLSSDFHLFVGFCFFFFVLEIVAFNSNTPLGKAGRNGSLSTSGGVHRAPPQIYLQFAFIYFVPGTSPEVRTYRICLHDGSTRWALFVSSLGIRTPRLKEAESTWC